MKSTFIMNLETRLDYHETVAITRDEFQELAANEGIIDELEESHSEAIQKEYDTGHEDGFDACKMEELKPLIEKCRAMFACHDAPAQSKLRKELPEAMTELNELISDIERRLKL